MLYHVSEQADIPEFVPRPSPPHHQPCVWAVDESHLRNYLLPRDCPRVTFAIGSATTTRDRRAFLQDEQPVVAIESCWYARVRLTRLYCYQFSGESFSLLDEGAGYYVSQRTAKPINVVEINNLFVAQMERSVNVRVLPSLWPLHDAVARSTLQFSMIRMRNATPRTDA